MSASEPGVRFPMKNRQGWVVVCFLMLALLAADGDISVGSTGQRRYLSYEEARPVLAQLADLLPDDLKKGPVETLPVRWQQWIKKHDAEIRARLIRGDEDSLVNFLLFGTSFTRQPRVTARMLESGVTGQVAQARDLSVIVGKVIEERIDDLIRGLASPGRNERLIFLRHFVRERGYTPDTPAGRRQLRDYLLVNLRRVLDEQQSYENALRAARALGNPTEEFAARSRLYRERGLSLDTSLRPNLAIEESLRALRDQKFLASGSVRRVAIIGPGLDFTDKQEGYDFYPQQSLQPFALIDSLIRLGLADLDRLQVVTFDISPRVTAHLAKARERARRGLGYTLQLPRDPRLKWTPELIAYWQRFGETIGRSVSPLPVPGGIGPLELRAVHVRPKVVRQITPYDLNVIVEHYTLPSSERFDLIIATNVFVYYDVLDQSLALANIERMLRPGGFLLSNNAVLELPGTRMRSVGYKTVIYSDRPDDGDHIVWYRRQPDQ
ncbi:MAG TPA: methyltransferase domain-containing protein [Blastocatellia bacterium]|nr:methyltransferase domain-containing protein [Blastocatellia bacterium]